MGSETILVLDPGESTGWVSFKGDSLHGGTIKHDRKGLWEHLDKINPDVLVFESFQLYASHAQSLIGNRFYTCEIIGMLKLYAELWPNLTLLEQGASVKKYSGAQVTDVDWLHIKARGVTVTEHTYDAYMHYRYYLKMQRGGRHETGGHK